MEDKKTIEKLTRDNKELTLKSEYYANFIKILKCKNKIKDYEEKRKSIALDVSEILCQIIDNPDAEIDDDLVKTFSSFVDTTDELHLDLIVYHQRHEQLEIEIREFLHIN